METSVILWWKKIVIWLLTRLAVIDTEMTLSDNQLKNFTANQIQWNWPFSISVTGTLTVEEVYKDRDQFAALVREVAAPDVGRMGIEILSFTIKDVYDDVQYLQSLGKAQTASVKRDADAGVAEANRDAGIREAECEKSAMDVKYSTDTKIEDNSRMYKLQKANFDQEINTAVGRCGICVSSLWLGFIIIYHPIWVRNWLREFLLSQNS